MNRASGTGILWLLLLAVFYLMFILSWRIFDNNDKSIKVSSIVAIIGLINVPIIKFSVDRYLHSKIKF